MAQIYGLNDKKERKIVAIKKLKENATEVERKILLHEIDLLSSVGQHENVLSLLGVIDEANTLMMIVEYCAKGGLQKYLKENKNSFVDQLNHDLDEIDKSLITTKTTLLTTLKLIEFTRQVANGMEYLESKGVRRIFYYIFCRLVNFINPVFALNFFIVCSSGSGSS